MINLKHQIELRHLRYFRQVALDLNFRKAAKNLFITQPGLSRQIKQLEEILSVQLLERNNKSVSLTEAGIYLLQESDNIINQIRNIAEQTNLIGLGNHGSISIGFVGSAMQDVIPKMLVKLHEHFPSVHTKLEELSNRRQIQALANHSLDVGFVRLEHLPLEIEHKIVFQDSFSLVLPEDHRINQNNFRNLYQLKDESFILFDPDYSQDYYNQIMSIFKQAKFVPRVDHKSVHANTIFRLVQSGLGLSIIPSALQKGFDIPLKFIELNNIKQRALLKMIWRKNNSNAALKYFLGMAE